MMEHFPGFTSCWSGATVTTEAEPAHRGRQTTEGDIPTKVKSTSKTTHNWKPKLQAISEDCPTSDVDLAAVYRQITETDHKKKPAKFRSYKSAATAAPPLPCHRKDYRKSCQQMALPAISTTPFWF